jgi:hypothetical protein
MLGKKLLTIACVVGILACGACFLPPIGNTPRDPPPPPLRDELRGIKTIDLFVDDNSDSHLVVPAQVAGRIGGKMDWLEDRTHINCAFRATPRPRDAVLRITLLKESATQRAPESSQTGPGWLLELTINATLTGPDGQILWQQKNVTYSDNESFQPNDPGEISKDQKILDWISGRFSDQLLDAMFYGN